jgi:hypothetical protein
MKDWKPTGWLGFSITGIKYINICDVTNMDLKINQLIAEIQMVAGEKLSSIQGMYPVHNKVVSRCDKLVLNIKEC